MRSSDYVHDKDAVNNAIQVCGSTILAKKPLTLIFPARFKDRGLAILEDVTYVLGFFALITEDLKYSVSIISAMIETVPRRVSMVLIDDVEYTAFHYEEGDKVVASMAVVMNDNLPHKIYTELYGKGKIPWYYGYTDIPKFFAKTGKYNGVTFGAGPAVWEYMAGSVCRDPNNLRRLYREIVPYNPNLKPAYVGLRNVAFNAPNVSARSSGSYFNDGLTISLTTASPRLSKMEELLRK